MEREIITNHLQEILDKKNVLIKDFAKFAKAEGVSRATVYRLAANSHCDMKESVSHKLQLLLNVAHDELITWEPDMSTFFDDNVKGLTQKNLKILDDEVSELGIRLHYQVYSRKNAMNVTTMYARNRRISLNSNFRIDTYGLPELCLTSLDIIGERSNTSLAELEEFQYQLLEHVANFARRIGMYKLTYVITQSEGESSQHSWFKLSSKQEAKLCKRLGFTKIGDSSRDDEFQQQFAKMFTSVA